MLPLLRIPKASPGRGRLNTRPAGWPRQRRHRLALALAVITAVLLAFWRQVAE